MQVVRRMALDVEPDYFQFYARRSGADWMSDAVPTDGYEAHLWTNGSFVYVGTERKFWTTPLVVEVWDTDPGDVPDEWQHVAEVSLDAGGEFEVYDWGSSEPAGVIPIDPGPVRLRVHWAGLVPDLFEGMDDDGRSDEHLLIHLWPAPITPAGVVRCWSEWNLPPLSTVSPDGRRQIEGLEGVVERLPRLTSLTGVLPHGLLRMPGGRDTSSIVSVLFDPVELTWWVDGYDIRRTLREVTEAEARLLVAEAARRT